MLGYQVRQKRTWAAENDGGDPDFLYAALSRFAYAAFSKESRIEVRQHHETPQQIRESPTIAFAKSIS